MLVEYSCYTEQICDTSCPNKDCIHHTHNKNTKENTYGTDYQHQRSGNPCERD